MALALVIPAAACGDDDRSGGDLGLADGAVSGDTVAPTVRSTDPDDGATEVARLEPLVIRFSEPMDTETGAIMATPGGPIPRVRWEWDRVGSTLTVRPTSNWAQGTIVVALAGFADPSGNVMEPYEFSFETLDDRRPAAQSSTPAEGATDVSAAIETVSVTFDEPMNTAVGSIALLGGAATVGAPEWNAEGTVVTVSVSDLEYEREYDAELRGFRDASGNALDPEPYLNDGVLDFTTGTDEDAPFVVRADPGEGTNDVNPAVTGTLVVTFNEPMDESVDTVVLSDGTDITTIRGNWQDSGRLLRIPVAGLLEFDTMYSVDLSNMRDRRGNALDGTVYLGDGSLDFTVSDDVFDPFVVASTPAEGETDVDFRGEVEVELTFSEAMDPAMATVILTGGGMSWTLEGTWVTSSVLSVTIPAELSAATAYALDLSMLRDLTGNAVDTSNAYLGDGVLDFTSAPPAGENCRDALTAAEATVVDGVYTWELTPAFVGDDDGGTACRFDDPTSTRPDAVVLYEKVSAESATSGKLLRIQAIADSYLREIAVAVSSGTCNPDAVMDRCVVESPVHDIYVDLPAGPVQVWVAPSDSTIFDEVTVIISEVDAPRPEGEACDNPFTVGGTFHTASAGADTWVIPQNYLRAMDISASSTGDTSLVSCDNTSTSTDTFNGTGVDGVIQYSAPADSVLRVTVDGDYTGSSLVSDFNVSAYASCDVTPVTPELYCEPSISTIEQVSIVDVPPGGGDMYFWITNEDVDWYATSSGDTYSNREVSVTIEPVPLAQGDYCSRAYAAATGANAVGGISTAQVVEPDCFGSTSNVEFYRMTATQALFVASANAAGGLALFRPGESTEFACSEDGMATPVSGLIEPGTDVCVAVEMGTGITSLNLQTSPYTGVGLVPPVDLPIERPVDRSGVLQSITADKWMSVSGNTLVFSWSETEMLEANADGSGTTLYRGSVDGLMDSNLGNVGMFNAAGALFSLDDDTSTSGSRIWRLWDGVSPIWDPIPWDVNPNYYAEDISAAAMVGNTLYYVTEGFAPAGTPRFYSLDTSSPNTPVFLGSNDLLEYAVGLAADDTYLYMVGQLDAGSVEGVFRLPITSVGSTPVNITPGINVSASSSPSQPVSAFVSGVSNPEFLYVRNSVGHVEVVLNPGSPSPAYIGEVIAVGGSSDYVMWLDKPSGSLYLFETDSDSSGNFLRYDTP